LVGESEMTLTVLCTWQKSI